MSPPSQTPAAHHLTRVSKLDTARVYSAGTSEELLGELGWQKRGLVMETKLYPNAVRRPQAASRWPLLTSLQAHVAAGLGGFSISHSPEDLRKHLDISLKALKAEYVFCLFCSWGA